MEKLVYDRLFKDCDFEVALDMCFSVADCEIMDMVDNRIQQIKFKDNLGDGFIVFNTSLGVFHHRVRFA